MSEMNLEEIGRRAVASRHWKWRPGMVTLGLIGEDIPDVAHPATLGCMLQLALEIHAPHGGSWSVSENSVTPDRARSAMMTIRPWADAEHTVQGEYVRAHARNYAEVLAVLVEDE